MIMMESPWPMVVRNPTAATSPVTRAFRVAVVPWQMCEVSRSRAAVSRPAAAASSSTALSTPCSKSGGVDGDLAECTRPCSSVANASVNVPPTSMPIT